MNQKALPNSNNALIQSYIRRYKKTKRPIAVSFKKTLADLNNPDRHTHLIHSYPAKLLMHIPHLFLNNTLFSKKGDYVLDPFCGTGTVLLESKLAQRNALGADSNPLARLITEVKTETYNIVQLRKLLTQVISRAKKYQDAPIPDVVNIDYWFPKRSQQQLARLLKAIKGIKDKRSRSFFLVCFSNCVKKVSYADPRISVPVRLNPNRFKKNQEKFIEASEYLMKIDKIDVFDKFKTICKSNIERADSLNNCALKKFKSRVISSDARNLTAGLQTTRRLKSGSVQLVITSPPYAGAQKYIRSSSLCLGWTELADTFELLLLDKLNIGREHFTADELGRLKTTTINKADLFIQKVREIDEVRAKIIAQYLLEMKSAIVESVRVLRKGGYFVLVIGNNKVCNMKFNTQEFLTEIIERRGLRLVFKLIDDIKSYGLMTKRNKTADVISREWVLVFKK
jgi:DNA modification methylase